MYLCIMVKTISVEHCIEQEQAQIRLPNQPSTIGSDPIFSHIVPCLSTPRIVPHNPSSFVLLCLTLHELHNVPSIPSQRRDLVILHRPTMRLALCRKQCIVHGRHGYNMRVCPVLHRGSQQATRTTRGLLNSPIFCLTLPSSQIRLSRLYQAQPSPTTLSQDGFLWAPIHAGGQPG